MEFPISIITKSIFSKLLALQTFFCSRPRIDVDLIASENSYGQKSLGISIQTEQLNSAIPINNVIYDFEFYWNYKLRIKNNSSKTAYNIKVEKIFKNTQDYLQKIDNIISLKENEIIELDYFLKHQSSKTISEAKESLTSFPTHLDELEIIISYTNESRIKFYTKFLKTRKSILNQHLFRKPKNL